MFGKFTVITLLLIILLAAGLRFFRITANPPGLNSDEVAIGYNAYSILKTGRDEYGQSFPLAFRSFDDYKPPLYIYLTVPSVALFGLNEFAVRFPSALLGIGAVLLTFFLTYEILSYNKLLSSYNPVSISLLASLLLALSPWHIQFTRTAYETGSLAFFTSLGLLFLIKGKKKTGYLVLSSIVFGLETYLYQAARVFVPAFVFLAVLILFWREIRSNLLRLTVFSVVLFLTVLPNLYVTFSPKGLLRFQGTSVFQDVQPKERSTQYKITDWLRNDNKAVLLFHRDFLAYFQPILIGYLSHFRPDFLVANNANPKNAYVPEVGLMYLWELPFLLLGLHFLLAKKDKTPFLLLFAWMLSAPIGAAVTNNVPSSVRTAAFLPSLQIVTAIGFWESVMRFRSLAGRYFRHSLLIFLFIVLWGTAFYLHMLFVHAPVSGSKNWYFGYKDVVRETQKLAPEYNQVIVSTGLDEPYIFFLFFEKYDPAKYQKEGGTVSGGFAEDRNHFGNYLFKPINWSKMKKNKNTLFVGLSSDFPTEAHIMKKFSYLDGTPSVFFAESEEK